MPPTDPHEATSPVTLPPSLFDEFAAALVKNAEGFGISINITITKKPTDLQKTNG